MQISKSAIKGKLVALAILYAMLTGARCWNGDPGARDSINDFAAHFMKGIRNSRSFYTAGSLRECEFWNF